MAYFLYYRAREPNRYFIEAIRDCDSALQSRNDLAILIDRKDERIARQAENRANWKICRDDIRLPYRQRLDRANRRIPFLAAAGLGTITFGWLVALLGVMIARRIKKTSS
jgi:hypothetical protein